MQDPILTPIFTAALVNAGLPTVVGATATFAGVNVAGVLAAATVLAATVGVSMLLQPGAPKPEQGTLPLKQTVPPRFYGFGEVRLAGAYMLYETVDHESLDVLGLAQGPCGGFKKLYLSDKAVDLNDAGAVQEFGDGAYKNGIVKVQARAGRKLETAYSIPELSGDEDVWTDDHRGDRVVSLFVRCEAVEAADFSKRYPDNVPKPSAVLFLPCWDFRDPSQNPDDPDTWIAYDQWHEDTAYVAGDRVLHGGMEIPGLDSVGGMLWLCLGDTIGIMPGRDARKWVPVWKNPVLQFVTYLTSHDIGMGLARTKLITPVLPALTAEAAKCDVALATRAGWEQRYASCPWYRLDTNPEEVLGLILASCEGWAGLDGNGSLALNVGQYEAPPVSATLTEDVILDVELNYSRDDESKLDELTLSVISPDHDYTAQEVEPWRNEAAILNRGKVRSKAFGPLSVQSYRQLRRLAKPMMLRANALRGTITTTLGGLAAAGKRYVPVEYSHIPELAGKIVEVRSRRTSWRDRRCSFEFSVIDPAQMYVFNPATEEGDPPGRPPPTPDTSLPTPSGLSAEAVEIDGVDWVALEWQLGSIGARPNIGWIVRYRAADAGSGAGLWRYIWIDDPEVDSITISTTVFIGDVGVFDLQMAARSPANTRSAWSSIVSVSINSDAILDNEDLAIFDNDGAYIAENA